MTLANYHTHTTYCDGKNTPEELIEEAIALGMAELGFSGHSYTDFDSSWCMSRENTERYRTEIASLKVKYKDKLSIKLGIEQDYLSDEFPVGYDFVIGGVHWVKKDGVYIPVDESAEILCDAIEKHYGGDIYALCEDYYTAVGDLYNRTGCDIIAHFDLVTKFNEGDTLFDTNNKRYKDAVRGALDILLKAPVLFEINTGAISRGYRTEPYPSADIIKIIKENSGKLILSSDCHDKKNLCFEFNKYKDLI